MMIRTSIAAFAALEARKMAQATRAICDPYITDFDHAAWRLDGIGNSWTRRLFGGDFYMSASRDAAVPACSLVFVQSRDGNTGAADPSVLGGGLTDKHVIYEGLSQVAADAVVSGAGTILGGEIVFAVWHPQLIRLREELGKPRYPVQIVATLHGLQLDEHLIFNVPAVQVIVLTIDEGARRMHHELASRPWVRPIVMSRPEDLPAAFDALHELGIRRICAVGGRHFARQLIDAGLVQDLYLTTAAENGGEPGTPIYPGPLRTTTLVRKHGTGRDIGVVFEHLYLEREAAAVF
jgi:riboflavin biosynthesis pyrimidine reductase